MKRCLIVFALLGSNLALFAAPPGANPQRAPWEWTDAERIASLRDVSAAASRVRAGSPAIRIETSADAAESFDTPVDVIDGRRDPHLYFEWELFDWLISTTYGGDNPQARDAFRAIRVRDAEGIFEVPADFWDRLGAISAAFISDKQRERELLRSDRSASERNAQLEVLYDALCRDRFAALEEAKHEFGPGFRRFLYGTVARGRKTVLTRQRDVDQMLWVGGGCR